MLTDRIERLFQDQLAAWPSLARGIDNLTNAKNRPVDVNGYNIFVRHLPHRIASTRAAVDRNAIEKRPCFLCKANLPPEENGIPAGPDFTIYCNPFPIVTRHLTIVHNEHRPQRIAGHVETMLALANDLPGYFLIYNGPECGASAPDHMHFQACSTSALPIVRDLRSQPVHRLPNDPRHVWILREATPEVLENAVSHWNSIAPRDPEPLLNLGVFQESGNATALLFPRSKHRPGVFYSGEFTVSPATIDLCGVFVTPIEKDFERITGDDIRRIYEEVTVADDVLQDLIKMRTL